MTHTHTGFAVRQPRRSGGRRGYNYSQATDASYGRTHALNEDGPVYRALCGATVERKYGHDDDLDGATTGHVQPGNEYAVTCAKCRAKLEAASA